MDKTKQRNIGDMADIIIKDEIETSADENGVFSDSSSDIEIKYDKQQRKLTARLDDELFDVKFQKKYNTQNDLLKDMLKKYLRQIETQRKHSNQYASKINNDETLKLKNQATKSAWFQENKDRLRQLQLERYNHDEDYRFKTLQKSKRAYEKRTEGVEKQKRGRKPKPIDPEAQPQIPKPRGRPKLLNKEE